MNQEHVTISLLNQDDKIFKPSFNKIQKILDDKKLSGFTIIDDLKVNNPNDFGKGYGKKAFLSILNKYKKVAFTPSFSDCDNYQSFSGREEISMNNLTSAPKNLLNKFYLPLLRKNNFDFEVIKVGSSDIVIVNPK